jgi:DNA mismatch repair protein MutL
VRDRTLAHAVSEAYSVATIKERSPEVHLFIDLPPDRVDVNVHPTKAEVRFLEQSLMHEVLRRALAETLGRGPAPELQLTAPAARTFEPQAMTIPGVLAGATVGSRWAPEPYPIARPIPSAGPFAGPQPWSNAGPGAALADRTSVAPTASSGSDAAAPDPGEPVHAGDFRPMIPLGQFRDTYIVAVDDEGIAIIDQHVAHERVLFEQVMEKLTSGTLESQRLLTPIVLELSAAQRQVLSAHAAVLTRFGLEVEDFGGGSVCLAAVPALLDRADCEAAVRALAEDLEGGVPGARVEDSLRRIAATMACHAAVKANYPLTLEKMHYILAELRRTAYSSVCPHGRPVVLRLTRREIEKNFQRI